MCNLVVEKAEGSSADIPQLVQTYIINNWEGQDNPEHLRTIRDRILRNEHNTSRLLGLYRQVLTSKVTADASPEQMELRLSGLVVKRNGCLQVYNNIYREIFDQGWIEAELNKLRPYSEAINGWLKSGRQDTSRLLRGETLEEALEWGREKNLSAEDYAFLSASQAIDKKEREQALEIEKLEAIKKEAELVIAEAQQGIRLERAGNEALNKFNSGEQQSALLMAMKAGQKLHQILKRGRWKDGYPATSPIFALQQILARIRQNKEIKLKATVKSVSFSPDGTMLAIADVNGSTELWSIEDELINKCSWHTRSVNSVSFSPDGKLLATGSSDRTARLWDLQGNQIAELVGHTESVASVSFSPDGKTLATGSYDNTARLWDLQGNQITKWAGHSHWVTSVSFSPDGKMLATGSSDNTARLWDLQGNQIAELVGHSNSVWSVSFSPDGKMLATASSDNTARLWPVENLEELLARGCEWLRGYFVNHPEALAELEVCRLAADFEADFEADG